jgi:GT2 family glycosyltransferase
MSGAAMTGSPPPFVLFVVPTYNRAADMPRTLGAIAAQHWPSERMAILVVDNGSTDDTAEVLAELARRLPCKVEHLRKAPEGPTVARNIGLRRGLGGFVALVDSDVELTPGWTAATCAALLSDPMLAQVGGPLVFGHDRSVLNSYGGVTNLLGLSWDIGEGGPASVADAPRDVLWINTSAVLFRPEPAVAAGGFDEGFFYACEEPDLAIRLAGQGWRNRVVPEAVAIHHVDTRVVPGAPTFVFHFVKNRVRMGLKSWTGWRLLLCVALNLGYGLADAALHPPRWARLKALLWNVANIRQTWRLRREVLAQRTVPEARIAALLEKRMFPPTRLHGLRRRVVPGAAVEQGADDRVVPGTGA